jgi:pectate lyase
MAADLKRYIVLFAATACISMMLNCEADPVQDSLQGSFVDQDGDNIADDFEEQYSQDLEPEDDLDSDGVSNEDESNLASDPLTPNATVPTFPGAQGFGAYAFGGRGDGAAAPRIIAVTTLEDRISEHGNMITAPGSLREAVEASGPRFVVFNVQGTIYLDTPLEIREPFMTIAGQTAGGDGIVLAHHGLRINTHDIVLRYLRVRILYEESDGLDGRYMDGLTAYKNDYQVSTVLDSVYNLVIDHCSLSWAIDETIDLWNWVRNFTIQWCIISNGALYGHQDGPEGYGFISSVSGSTDDGTNKHGSLHHNLFGQNAGRNPLIADGKYWDLRNNVVYNWSVTNPIQIFGGEHVNFVGNYLIAGLDVSITPLVRYAAVISPPTSTPHPQLFVHDNFGPLRATAGQDDWDVGIAYLLPNVGGLCAPSLSHCTFLVGPDNYQPEFDLLTATPTPTVSTLAGDSTLSAVLAGAGATHPRRDAVDSDLAAEVEEAVGAQSSGSGLKHFGPHHGPLVDVLWFHPAADPTVACFPRQHRLSAGEDLDAAKAAMLAQMTCTLPGGLTLPDDAAAILADPVTYPFDVVPRVIPDRATVDGLYTSDANPTLPLDSDGDHIPDAFELTIGSDPGIDDSLQDADGDGYLNIEEYLNSL